MSLESAVLPAQGGSPSSAPDLMSAPTDLDGLRRRRHQVHAELDLTVAAVAQAVTDNQLTGVGVLTPPAVPQLRPDESADPVGHLLALHTGLDDLHIYAAQLAAQADELTAAYVSNLTRDPRSCL